MKNTSNRVVIWLGLIALTPLSACSGGEQEPDQTPVEATPTANTAAPTTAPALPVAYASLTGDAAKGEKIFIQCRSCHTLDAGVNRVGPSLHAIVGSAAGQVADYNYSDANKKSGLTWDEETLFAYLAAPQKTVPGTKMAFAGLPQPQDRADLIAYLKTASK